MLTFQYCGEFDNWGAVMSVSAELLCSFELLKPLDSSALKSHIKKGRNKRQQMLNSPVSFSVSKLETHTNLSACERPPTELLNMYEQGFGRNGGPDDHDGVKALMVARVT